MDDFSIYIYIFLWCIGAFAGFVDSIAGGGGLLTVPALTAAGVPPQMILGTNKLQGSFGSFSSSLKYLSSKEIELRSIASAFLCSLIGSAIGSSTVQQIHSDFLKPLILIMLIAVALFFIFSPKMSDTPRESKLTPFVFALIFGTSIGFYDGFFGPGTGSFFVIALMTMRGFGLKAATMRAKILNLASNIGALTFFIIGGAVLWKIGLLMATGQFIGARIGAGMVMSKGTALIRPMVIVIAVLMSAKSLLDYFGFSF
ncbi:MAG: TSUP family transporter [Alphaproteobacteria bacterium]